MADNRNSRNEKHLGLSPDPSRPQPAEAMLLEGDEKSGEVENTETILVQYRSMVKHGNAI